MLHLLFRVFVLLLVLLLVSRTDCVQRDQPLVHVRVREVNCSLPCQRDDNGTCVDDCPLRSYCDAYFNTCVGCPQHCLLCMSSDYCEECDNGFQVVGGGLCKASCKLGYYDSPYATQCLACSPNCLNCSGLNQCYNCSNNYSLYDDIARQVCILPCSNGSFYNQTGNQCQACAEHCQRCLPLLGCAQCEDNYVISGNICLHATPTMTTATPTVTTATPTMTTATPTVTTATPTMTTATPTVTTATPTMTTATPTMTMQTSTSMKSPSNTVVQSTAMPSATLEPGGSKKHDVLAYILGGVGGGVIAIVTLTVIIVVYYRRRKSSVYSKPLLQFDDDTDEEDSNNDKIL